MKKRILILGLLVFALVVSLAWYQYRSTTVPEVQKRLIQEIPLGTPRTKVEEWLKVEGYEHRYSTDFRFNSQLEENGIQSSDYGGYLVALIRDTEQGIFVTGSIQFYVLFDHNDLVAKHIVCWVGTGP